MWKFAKALDLPAPTTLLAAWLVPPAAAEFLGEVPAPPEPAVIMFAGICLIWAASALRGGRRGGSHHY